MQRSEPDWILQGVIGGLLAGAIVVAWFFAVDVAANEAFTTPSRLASIVLGEEFRGPWPRLVVVYTILHFGIFASLGVAAVWFLELIDVRPGLIVGAVFGVGVLNAVHYAGLLATGTNLLTVVPVVHVTAANLLGGMAMMAYFHRAFRAESPLGWQVLKQHPLLYDGLLAGLIGAAVVALWFFVIDVLTSQPFHTPAALGSAILLGVANPLDVQFNLGVIVAYSFLHLVAFALVGLAFTGLATRVRYLPGFWLPAVVVLALLEGIFFGSVAIMSEWIVGNLGWLRILVANVLAVVSMGAWIWWKRMTPRNRPPERA